MRCRLAIASGDLGAPLLLDMSSGMNIAGQGTHTLNYGRSLVGDPRVERVFAAASGWDETDPGHPAPSTTVAQLEFENGLRALWTTGDVAPATGDPETTWQHVRVSAFADRGHVTYEEFGKWEIVRSRSIEHGSFGGMENGQRNNLLAQSSFHKAMFDWLEEAALEPGTSLQQSLHEWATVLAVYQSALERRPISLANFSPSSDLIAAYRQAAVIS